MSFTRVAGGLVGLSLVLAVGAVGCVSSSDGDNTATGGTGGSLGGAAGATASSGAGGKATSSTGGASSTGEPGATACGKAEATITDFTYVEGTSTDKAQVTFGDFTTTFSGGTYVYPNGTAMYALTSDVTNSSWHVTGMVGDYSGLGLFFNDCFKVDVSAFSGISFTVSGTLPSGMSTMTLSVGTAGDDIPSAWLNAHDATAMAKPNFGRCMPASNRYDGSCNSPNASFSVTPTPTTVTIKWTDLKGGKPEATLNPSELTSIVFVLPNPAGVGTAAVTTYPVDITIDDLKFVP